jgi:Colicin D/Pretoxin HINT domain
LEVRSANSFEAELGLLTYPTKATSLLIPIEQVPLGARVPTKNPKPWEYDDSLPDPVQADWAKIAITMHRNDGGIVDAELLRPRWWIAQQNIVAGKHLPLNIEELQVRGSAMVTSVEDCPEIAGGQGSVVTAKFLTREVNTIARVEILGVDGQIEVLEGTTIHPIWSIDRDDWIQLSELQEGERLQATDRIATVVSIAIVTCSLPVYNIEVHGEHVYQVGELGLLVHNTCVIAAAQLQSKFKHAIDFGVTGNANKTTLAAFSNAITDHVTSLGTTLVSGTYRGNPVNIFVDPLSKLAVLTDRTGNFISGWKLSAGQLWNVLNRGSL